MRLRGAEGRETPRSFEGPTRQMTLERQESQVSPDSRRPVPRPEPLTPRRSGVGGVGGVGGFGPRPERVRGRRHLQIETREGGELSSEKTRIAPGLGTSSVVSLRTWTEDRNSPLLLSRLFWTPVHVTGF